MSEPIVEALELPYGTIVGDGATVHADGSDANPHPDVDAFEGVRVIFTPSDGNGRRVNTVIWTGADGPTILHPQVETGRFEGGRLVLDVPTPPQPDGMRLMATVSDDMVPNSWGWKMEWQGWPGGTAPGRVIFPLTPDATVDIAEALAGYLPEVPAVEFENLLAAAAEVLQARDEVQQISGLTGEDDAVAFLIGSSSDTRAALESVPLTASDDSVAALVAGSTATRAALESAELPATDASVAGLLGSPTATRTALTAAIVAAKPEIDVRDHGAVWDGITDDSAAIQAAANLARDTGARLYLPAGEGRIASKVDVYTSVRCDGTILIGGGSAGGIEFQRTATPITLDALTFDLTEGNVSLPGLPAGQTGAIYLQHLTENIINRYTGGGTPMAPYYKSEVSSVIHPGVLGQPLANTYVDKAGTQMFFYPAEPRVQVDGLRIVVDGTGAVTGSGRVVVLRDRVTFNDLEVRNDTDSDQSSPFVARWCVDIELNRATIAGFYDASGGYGVMGSSTADLRLRDCIITGCRHAVSGQKNKALLIEGGRYEGGIDDHWTYGLTVRNISNTVRSDHLTPSHVHVAGQGGVTISDCTFTGGNTIISIRSDSPELADTVLVERVRLSTPVTDRVTGIRYYVASLADRDYGRPYLRTPSRTVFRDCEFTVPGTAIVDVVNAVGIGFEHYAWGEVIIDNATMIGGDQLRVYMDPAPHLRPVSDPGPRIRVNRVDFVEGSAISEASVWVQNTGGQASTPIQAATVEVVDCRNVRVVYSPSVLGALTVDRSHLLSVTRNGTNAQIDHEFLIRDSALVDFNASGFWEADFAGNTWTGDADTTNFSTMDGRVRSYRGNLHAVGATGHPTHPDGYKNPTYYQTT